MVIVKKIFYFFILTGLHTTAWGQHGFLQQIALSDTGRVQQLTDTGLQMGVSFCLRPIRPFFAEKKSRDITARFTHVSYTLQNNSKLPLGDNDESFFPSVGFQQRITVGAIAQVDGFMLKLQPEFVTAANQEPTPFQWPLPTGNFWANIYQYINNKIDMYSRFGTKPITQLFPGQSSISYTYQSVSAGLSTENIWWGPGLRNSLVMTNNAPGFAHLTVNTVKPIITPIGSFEGQVILGRLDSAGFESPDNVIMRNIWPDGIAKKSADTRMIAGIMMVWQPKWIKNLYLGFASTSNFYSGSENANANDAIGLLSKNKRAAKLGSLFFRYAMPEEHAEFYFEYGRADKPASIFNIFEDTIPTGYVAGVRKLLKTGTKDSYIELAAEITQLRLPDPSLIFDSNNPFNAPKTNSWYTHNYVAQGYTNRGQLMGAAIGPGSNSQTINVSWINGLKKIGIQFERVLHNNDFYYYNYFNGTIDAGYKNKHWTDLSIGLHGRWDYKDFVFALFANYTSALNYRWVKLDGSWQEPSLLSDKQNTQIVFSLQYKLGK
ncbi:MAG: capsule assembly Wzi family protein [Bacteroidota bacterium]